MHAGPNLESVAISRLVQLRHHSYDGHKSKAVRVLLRTGELQNRAGTVDKGLLAASPISNANWNVSLSSQVFDSYLGSIHPRRNEGISNSSKPTIAIQRAMYARYSKGQGNGKEALLILCKKQTLNSRRGRGAQVYTPFLPSCVVKVVLIDPRLKSEVDRAL